MEEVRVNANSGWHKLDPLTKGFEKARDRELELGVELVRLERERKRLHDDWR